MALLMVASCTHREDPMYAQLDRTMENDSVFIGSKEKHIAELRSLVSYNNGNPEAQLRLYDDLYQAYSSYNYDSAMCYARRALSLAQETGNYYYKVKNTIYRSFLLSSAGFYHESERQFDTIDSIAVPEKLKFEYYYTHYKMYTFWNEYYNDSELADSMKPSARASLAAALRYTKPKTADYYLLRGGLYRLDRDYANAIASFRQAMRCYGGHSADDNETHNLASASYDIALCSLCMNDTTGYEENLIQAAIYDIKCGTKETAALQALAFFVYSQRGHVERAERYINFSARDARQYDSRLRMIGIGKRLPLIVSAYQREINSRTHWLMVAIAITSLLSMSLIAMLFFYVSQNNKLRVSRMRTAVANRKLSELNGEIEAQNRRLVDINDKRENLAKVYIDLCARYIDSFEGFKTMAKRKIKANQTKELLARLSSAELSDEDADTFLSSFDKAFLELYPDFVNELNALLRPECRYAVGDTPHMRTEQRIAAFMRLGVKDSSIMARLLFYSPQTIYNYRWGMKQKALSKETFEEQVTRLCR